MKERLGRKDNLDASTSILEELLKKYLNELVMLKDYERLLNSL